MLPTPELQLPQPYRFPAGSIHAHNGRESAGGQAAGPPLRASSASLPPEHGGQLLSGRLWPAAQPLLARNCSFPP